MKISFFFKLELIQLHILCLIKNMLKWSFHAVFWFRSSTNWLAMLGIFLLACPAVKHCRTPWIFLRILLCLIMVNKFQSSGYYKFSLKDWRKSYKCLGITSKSIKYVCIIKFEIKFSLKATNLKNILSISACHIMKFIHTQNQKPTFNINFLSWESENICSYRRVQYFR